MSRLAAENFHSLEEDVIGDRFMFANFYIFNNEIVKSRNDPYIELGTDINHVKLSYSISYRKNF